MKQRAHAKVNLFLEVTGRMDNGYHTLCSLMCCIGLHDTLHFDFSAIALEVRCSDPQVPSGEGNLAWRAARLFFETAGIQNGNEVRIHIEKRIPAGAGLGGGSSDAACVLTTLNQRFGSPFDGAALNRLGAAIGADVPFFLLGRPAIAEGIGERLTSYDGLAPHPLLVVSPGRPLATAEVYKNLKFGLTKKEKLNKHSTFRNRVFEPKRDLFNDLEQPAMAMEPEIAVVKTALLQHGALGALMSGSGSSVFGVYSDGAAARHAKRLLERYDRWTILETGLLVEKSL